MPKHTIWRTLISLTFVSLLLTALLYMVHFHHTMRKDLIVRSDWLWFEDSYFNLRFQYPPRWIARRAEITKYQDDSNCSLGGEDAAVAAADPFKVFVIVIEPTYSVGSATRMIPHPMIRIEQPGSSIHGDALYSNAIRTGNRRYEYVLDQYSSDKIFQFTDREVNVSTSATTSVSRGYADYGSVRGITALKEFTSGYKFQVISVALHPTVILPEDALPVDQFLQIVDSMQLLDARRAFNYLDYQQEVNQEKVIYGCTETGHHKARHRDNLTA